MAKTYQYCVAENWGKGFIDHVESQRITFVSFPGNVWQVPAYNKDGNLWIAKVAGTVKTRDEAQAIVDAEITKAQNAWDADNVDGETAEEKNERLGIRATAITLDD
tara:strand:- start:1229 stop:1546 length:318 start_codon:yes stop_codon:yes gene_type:complete